MNKMLKSTLGVATAVAITGATVAPAVLAWGDNAGGRATYSLKQINSGAIDNKIVFNSIVTDESELKKEEAAAGNIVPMYDERNFVGARVDDGNHGKNNVWEGNEITVQEGKTYVVRMYIHNNNRLAEKMTAKDVTASFLMQDYADKTFKIDGTFTSSNATPSKYWDSVVFKSSNNRSFYLDYVEGSTIIESNGAVNGTKLSDDVIGKGVKIGYDKLDGNLPGCYKYAAYVSFKVKPVFEDKSIEKKARLDGTKEWKEDVEAKVGDTVEYQIHYTNLNNTQTNNVVVIDTLPENMEYIKGTTMLYNSLYPSGAKNTDETLTTKGINIGNYKVGAEGYVRFKAKVTDKSLVCGTNQLVNWAKIIPDSPRYAIVDSANVITTKTCDKKQEDKKQEEKKQETKKEDTKKQETKKTEDKKAETTTTVVTKTETTSTTKEMPSTGPATTASAALGAGSIVTAAGYLIKSRKQLRK